MRCWLYVVLLATPVSLPPLNILRPTRSLRDGRSRSRPGPPASVHAYAREHPCREMMACSNRLSSRRRLPKASCRLPACQRGKTRAPPQPERYPDKSRKQALRRRVRRPQELRPRGTRRPPPCKRPHSPARDNSRRARSKRRDQTRWSADAQNSAGRQDRRRRCGARISSAFGPCRDRTWVSLSLRN